MTAPTRRVLDSPRLSCLVAGPEDGEVVACFHGFPDVPRTFLPLLAALGAAGYRAVAPWMRGYAPSTRTGPYDLDRLSRDVLEVCDAFTDRPACLVGHDWGAAAVWLAVARWPRRFRRAVTMAVPHPAVMDRNLARHPSQLGRSSYMALLSIPGLAEGALRRDDFALVDRLWRAWSPGYRLPADHRDELLACLASSLPAPVRYYRALRTERRAVGALFGRAPIEVPVLHVHGSRDGCIGPEMIDGQGRVCDEHEAVVVGGAGHFVHLERPDVVNERVLGWLGR